MASRTPPAEEVRLDFGFSMNVDGDDPDGIRLMVVEAGARKVLGILRFSRRTLADLLASRSEQPATWQDYRPRRTHEQHSVPLAELEALAERFRSQRVAYDYAGGYRTAIEAIEDLVRRYQ